MKTIQSKNHLNSEKLLSLEKALAIVLMIMALVPIYAGDNGIFSGLDEGTSTILTTIINFFNKTFFPCIGISLLILMGLNAKNEKRLPVLQEAFKWLCYVFVGVNGFNLLTNTLMWVVNSLKGTP